MYTTLTPYTELGDTVFTCLHDSLGVESPLSNLDTVQVPHFPAALGQRELWVQGSFVSVYSNGGAVLVCVHGRFISYPPLSPCPV